MNPAPPVTRAVRKLSCCNITCAGKITPREPSWGGGARKIFEPGGPRRPITPQSTPGRRRRPMNNATVLVTGAAGFIGSHVCEALLARGHRVVGVDNFCDFYPRPWKEANVRAIGSGMDLQETDITDGPRIRRLIE